MRNLVLLAVIAMAVVAGCHTQGNTPDNGTALPPTNTINDINEGRMAPTAAPSQAILNGRITLTGFQLQSSPGTGGGTGSFKVLAHLVDEEDDILSATLDGSGNFSLAYNGTKTSLKLKITADTTEDLDGNGTSGDQIVQTVPVKLLTGLTASVDMAIMRGTKPMMDTTLWPLKGAVIVSDMIRQDGNGRDSVFFGTFLDGGFDVISTDGDKVLGTKDLRQPDLNRDGWPDASEQLYTDPGLVPATVEGVVLSVSVVNRTLLVQGRSGATTLIYLQPFAAMEPLGTTGVFGAEQPLDSSLVGRWVMATGRMAPEGLMADWLVISPPGTS